MHAARPFWNAVAPMLAAAIMSERAPRFLPSFTAVGSESLIDAHAFERDAVRQRVEPGAQ